jgi:hypothetical protein
MPKLGSHLDFNQLEARNEVIHNLSAAPSSPVKGQLYFDTVANSLYYYNGSTWIAAGAGAGPADATTSSKGIVQLAGDLAGTAASPQIAAGVILDADVNAAAAIQESKLTLATDAAVGTGSRRTLGAGAQQAMPGNRTLDAITAPAADLSLNTHKLTNVVDPTNPTDGATKNYVDLLTQGLSAKASVHAATAGANIATLAGGAPNTLDGVTLAANDRVLVKDQTTANQNGIYVVTTLGTGVNGSWTRATDMDAWTEVPSAYVWVQQGTVNADTGWVCTADPGGTLGTTSITWVLFAAAQDVQNVARYYNNAATHSAGTTITITQTTHLLRASRALHVQVQDNTTGNVELPDISVASNGDVTITYAASVSANTKLVTIVG